MSVVPVKEGHLDLTLGAIVRNEIMLKPAVRRLLAHPPGGAAGRWAAIEACRRARILSARAGRRQLVNPGVEQRNPGAGEVSGVARHDGQAMLQAGGRDEQMRLREGMAGLAPVLHQQTPLEHHSLRHGKHTLLEHRPQPVVQPVNQLGSVDGVADHFNAQADLGKSHRADEELRQRLGRHKSQNPCLGPWLAQL